MKHKSTKKTDIAAAVKKAVWERDNHRCVLCGSPNAMPNAHYISRAHGGLGIEQNVVTLCIECHRKVDQSVDREYLLGNIKMHLQVKYPIWDERNLVYTKWTSGIHSNPR